MSGKGTQIPTIFRTMVKNRDRSKCCRCGMNGAEWHHRRSRSVVDDCQHAVCNGVWLCRRCHTWVHKHPFEAREAGLIVSRYAVPHDEPVRTVQHGWVRLRHDGTVVPHERED